VDLLPLGTSRQAVRELLGPPRSATTRTWSYVAARRRPADGYGGWCERRFEVRFDKKGRVTDVTLRPPTCPRANNP
jgi:outer membrane protein assembly factor BamE (lipoprotein component of BamABCDE complex)